MTFPALRTFYEQQLFGDILPFWMKRGVDRKLGGFFTCFSNRGVRLLHPHKFTWSQGRFVWMLSRLAREFKSQRPAAEVADWLEDARRGAEFLMRHARLPNGSCAFILSEEGEPILLGPDGAPRKAGPGEVYDTSVYADLFVVYGLAEYAMAAGDRKAYDYAANLYDSSVQRFYQPAYRSDPYPVPSGYEAHGRPMILVETVHEMALAAESFGDRRAEGFLDQGKKWMSEVLGKFRDPKTNLICEMYSRDPAKRETMLGGYINPGHTIESMWFMCHLALKTGLKEAIPQALQTILAACRVGWDEPHGGFTQFAHRTGGAPCGSVPTELEGAEMIRKLRNNWDNKLWWPHSEALYALLLGYQLSGVEEMMDWYWKVHEYAFRTFPNPDQSIGEWIQIRDRYGAPEEKVVALPVKDPFHITRTFILCMNVLGGKCTTRRFGRSNRWSEAG
jgi:N-acylglucosamine 2-epimerase